MTSSAQASMDCWHMLYVGLIKEFGSIPDERMTHMAPLYLNEVGYSFGRYKAQEAKVRKALKDG